MKVFSVVVIFDSNIIFGLPVSKEVRDFIESLKTEKKVRISYYVPETVLEEAKKKFLNAYKDARERYHDAIKTISMILRTKKFSKLSTKETTLEKKVEKTFSSFGIETLLTPNEKINWSDLRKSAVFQKPPFSQGDSEKGFKDALIAQTILISLRRFRTQKVAIICRDGLLSDFLREKTKGRKNVTIYPSLPDFHSQLRLLLLGDRLIDEITNEAKLAFYNPQDALSIPSDRKSIFYREEFPKQILVKFPSLFANPKVRPDPYYGLTTWHSGIQVNWVPVKEPTFEVAKPVFIGKSGNGDYIWQSTVVYRQIFQHEMPSGGLYGGFSYKGEQRLEFLVKWASPVDKNGKIDPTRCTIKDITLQTTLLEPFYASAGLLPPMASNATQAGQGTIPVVPVSGTVEITEPIFGLGDQDTNKE